MKFIEEYISDFGREVGQRELGDKITILKSQYDVRLGGDPSVAFEGLVGFYNWLGLKETKAEYSISSNLARNLPGALMQDWLISLMTTLTHGSEELMLFTEVRVPFGNYPVWERGDVNIKQPSEKSDLAVGYLRRPDGSIEKSSVGWPNPVFNSHKSLDGRTVVPLITVNSKIRVSQSEFFDWQGREQLMTKGNPHCLSIQVALRKEMDLSIIEAAQAGDKFFLLGEGGETNVSPNVHELERMIETVQEHLEKRMRPGKIIP